mmetsp:Transcript_39808/g.93288  ORF Transcript_39808/g.93288 Transcript_39808/m.93288 type:complete len:236 (-) Transcript_39808:999-1706(-)
MNTVGMDRQRCASSPPPQFSGPSAVVPAMRASSCGITASSRLSSSRRQATKKWWRRRWKEKAADWPRGRAGMATSVPWSAATVERGRVREGSARFASAARVDGGKRIFRRGGGRRTGEYLCCTERNQACTPRRVRQVTSSMRKSWEGSMGEESSLSSQARIFSKRELRLMPALKAKIQPLGSSMTCIPLRPIHFCGSISWARRSTASQGSRHLLEYTLAMPTTLRTHLRSDMTGE